MKEHILFITENFILPCDEGTKKVTYSLAKTLEKNFSLLFISEHSHPLVKKNIISHYNKLFLSSRLFLIIRNFSPGIILYIPQSSCTFNSFLRAKILKLYSKKSKVVMLSLQKREISSFLKSFLPFLKPDCLYVSSLESGKVFKNISNVKYFYPGVDLNIFHPVDVDTKFKLREKYNILQDKFIFLHVGHINKKRNLSLLVNALNRDDLLVVVGSTSTLKEESLYEELKKEKNVKIITSYIEKIQEIYQLSDCYIFPVYNYKSAIDLPLSVLEAMACNLPVITTKFGGLVDLFKEESSKGFFYFDTEENLREKIKIAKSIKNIETREKAETLSWEKVINKFIEDLKKIVNKNEYNKKYFISIVGIDGSGKTTQVKILYSLLKKEFSRVSCVWCRWEPLIFRPLIKYWKKRQSKENLQVDYLKLRNKKITFLKKSLFRWFWLLGFIIEYGIQIFWKIRIKKYLKKEIIISDRYFYDSFIDQAINLNLSDGNIFQFLNKFWIRRIFQEPNLVIYIDCPEEVAFNRKKNEDSFSYLKERRELYLNLAKRCNWKKVDGSLSINAVASKVRYIVHENLRA